MSDIIPGCRERTNFIYNKLVKTLEPRLLAKSLGSQALTLTYYQSIC